MPFRVADDVAAHKACDQAWGIGMNLGQSRVSVDGLRSWVVFSQTQLRDSRLTGRQSVAQPGSEG